MKSLKIKTKNHEETIQVGKIISSSLSPGSGVLLTGELGTGKTTLIRGICSGLGIADRVRSSSFVLAWLYEGNMPVYHVDLYRLDNYEDLQNIGWEEMVEESKIYLVEWADRFPLPYTEKALKVKLKYGKNPDERFIKLRFDENLFPKLERDLEKYDNSRN